MIFIETYRCANKFLDIFLMPILHDPSSIWMSKFSYIMIEQFQIDAEKVRSILSYNTFVKSIRV